MDEAAKRGVERRIGILGGSFNPIHKGHLYLGNELKKRVRLDEVWFVPAKISPHKLDKTILPAKERLEMIALAIGDEPSFRLLDWEAKREGPSFTVETLRYLKKCYPNDRFFLLLGEDSAKGFDRWKAPREILQLADVVVASRESETFSPSFDDELIDKKLREGFIPIPPMEVSSSEIRSLIASGGEAEELLPKPVCEYIKSRHLYREKEMD